MSEGLKRSLSPETRAKISASKKAYHAKQPPSFSKRNERILNLWQTMKQRCENPNREKYAMYGGRGIRVCDEWHDSHAFVEWALANGYEPGKQLDRTDNDGSYSPDNCRWVSGTRNMRNTSQTFPVIARRLIDGMEIRFESEADAAEFMSIPKSSIRDCVNGKQTQTHGFEWSKDNRRAERTCGELRGEPRHDAIGYSAAHEDDELWCEHCDIELDDSWRFCPNCGSRITEVER